MRVVFDANIFISAFVISGSKAEKAYLQALEGKFQLYSSIAILREIAEVLKRKFKWSNEKITAVLIHIAEVARITSTKPTVHFLADEPDNRILECAVAVDAEFIVTGDKQILSLGYFKRSKIIPLSAFLDQLYKMGASS